MPRSKAGRCEAAGSHAAGIALAGELAVDLSHDVCGIHMRDCAIETKPSANEESYIVELCCLVWRGDEKYRFFYVSVFVKY